MSTKPALSLWNGETLIKKFDAGDRRKSREAGKFGVWIRDNRVYKLFSKKETAEKLKETSDRAIAADVPTPEIVVMAATWIDEKGQANRVHPAVMEELSGANFQLSKQGHLTTIERTIKSADSPQVRQTTLAGLKAAEKFNLTDPQGFFNAKDARRPLAFIDIHEGTVPPHQLVDLRKFVEELVA